ncbi:MAG: hypothetical protein M1823_005120 [Watsoniomyces obsoletus]|nr:MAG: hypothetical protein M1823_005120 [Watsoniomyces obsoletus]
MSASGKKTRPTALVTDAREQQSTRPSTRRPALRPPTRLISVDNVLQFSSDIPSGQSRGVPSGRRPSLKPSLTTDPRLLARLTPQNIPPRTTKVSEKLVLLPETVPEEPEDDEDGDVDKEDRADYEIDNEAAPTRDDEAFQRDSAIPTRGKSYAERLPKARRAEKLARVTAYCTAEGYNMRAAITFFRTKHAARTKLYDDCLYTIYQRPLLPGLEGYRVRSSPGVRIPGGKSVLDEEIERSEQSHHGSDNEEEHDTQEEMEEEEEQQSSEGEMIRKPPTESRKRAVSFPEMIRPEGLLSTTKTTSSSSPQGPGARPDATSFAEMFVFSYGVVVFWNFTERQEKDILADMTFSSSYNPSTSSPTSSTTTTSISATTRIPAIVSRPQREEDFETEEFHFEYSPTMRRPRVFNDMITLRSGGDHMIKLAMSHAIAQSTKLSFFEERMANTMGKAQYIPRKLALTGELGMKREEVVKILGRLFKSRVDVNLCMSLLFTFPMGGGWWVEGMWWDEGMNEC